MSDKNLKPSSKELPNYVIEVIKLGQEQARKGLTKSTEEMMKKYSSYRSK